MTVATSGPKTITTTTTTITQTTYRISSFVEAAFVVWFYLRESVGSKTDLEAATRR